MTSPYRTLRLMAVGARTHLLYQARSPLGIAYSLLLPLVYATLATYLFRTGERPEAPLEAAVGAGLMGMWTSVLFGSAGAVQDQRGLGVLETLVCAPVPLHFVLLPITLVSAAVGTLSLVATLMWSFLLFGTPLSVALSTAFLTAVPVCVLSLGLTGLLMAATFVLLRNANALANTLEYPVWLLSGMLVPVSSLPGWTAPLSWILPPTWGAKAVHAAATGDGPVLAPMALALGLGLICLVLAAFALVHVERRARAAATLALS